MLPAGLAVTTPSPIKYLKKDLMLFSLRLILLRVYLLSLRNCLNSSRLSVTMSAILVIPRSARKSIN